MNKETFVRVEAIRAAAYFVCGSGDIPEVLKFELADAKATQCAYIDAFDAAGIHVGALALEDGEYCLA